MKVEVSADTPLSESVMQSIVGEVEHGLGRFGVRLTRAEVHLKDLERTRSGRSPECRLEVRAAGQDPVAVSDQSASLEEAVAGAVAKMERLLDSKFGRLDSPRGGASASGLPT